MSKPTQHTLESYHSTYKSSRKDMAFLMRCARMSRHPVGVQPEDKKTTAAPDWMKHVTAYLDKLLASPKLLPK